MKTDKEFLVRGSLINGLGLITRAVSPLLLILLARFYPQKELGLFLSFQALVLTLARIPILGLEKGLLWYIPRMQSTGENGNLGVADSLRVCLVLGSFLSAGLILAGMTGFLNHFDSLREVSMPFLLLMMGALLPYSAVQIFSGALEGKRLPQYRVFLSLFLVTSLVPVFAMLLKGVLGAENSLAAGMFLGNLPPAMGFP